MSTNGTGTHAMSSTNDLMRALDPQRSAVVEACAGSGKTWLLVSRMLRLLLAGAAPGSILALTFTRKAAQEMRARLDLWLRALALSTDADALHFLQQRGLNSGEARAALPRARGLYEAALTAQPGVAIDTFHGWFFRVIGLAPLSPPGARSGPPTAQQMSPQDAALIDAPGALLAEAWQRFAVALGRAPDGAPAAAFTRLLSEIGLANTRTVLFCFANRRSEWWAYTAAAGAGAAAEFADQQLRAQLDVHEGDAPVQELFARECARISEFAALLARNTPSDQEQAAILTRVLQIDSLDDNALAEIRGIWLTQSGEPRKRKASAAQRGRLGAAGEESYLDLHESLSRAMQDAEAALLERRICDFNRDAFVLGDAFINTYQHLKAARAAIDFNDIEWQAAQLLTDSDHAAYLHERLDARIKHLLLDEFQDTNPLQWAALRGWLDAYGSDGARPTVLLVGDPKQSIYRFRRADVRLFDAAQHWLRQSWNAAAVRQNETRRNAPALVEVINQVFGALPGYAHFQAQTTARAGVPGRVELLPLIAPVDKTIENHLSMRAENLAGNGAPNAPAGTGAPAESALPDQWFNLLRNPLTTARPEQRDLRRRDEGRQIALRIAQLVGVMAVVEEKNGQRSARPAQYGDIKILARKKSAFAEIEAALRELRIPYLSARGGGLLETLEASDLVALLSFLVSPGNDLAFAHALKSPVFGAADQDLILLAGLKDDAENGEYPWWERLLGLSPESSALTPALARARDLLARWLPLADALPVHDLLDRVYHEADLHARYAAAAPAHLAAGIAANLDAFIALALEVDHGRFPSLPRFIEELKSARRGADEEAPDEGIAESDATAAIGVVQLLTVHGAKGLEAPIVFLADANAGAARERGYEPLIEWPPDAAAPTHFSLLASITEIGRGRLPVIDAARASAHTEERNLLYVAMTRAGQLLVVSGIDSATTNTGTNTSTGTGTNTGSQSAYRLIEAALRGLSGADGTPQAHGDLLPGQAATALPAPALQPDTALKPAPTKGFGAPAEAAQPTVTAGQRRAAPSAAMRAGILTHAYLQGATGARDAGLSQPQAMLVFDDLVRRLGATADEIAAARAQGAALLATPQLNRWFDPQQFCAAHNELEILAGGETKRLDRLVEFDAEVWVLDYKARVSEGDRAAYFAQLAGYVAAVTPLYPGKTIHAALVDLAGCIAIALP